MKKTTHRVTVWAGGVKGYPVSCTCGWKDYAKTSIGGYDLKHAHLAVITQKNATTT